MSAFSRVDVSSWPFDEEEKAGKSEKLWVRDPEEPNVARSRWLFKPVTEHANGTVQGGDWAEKVSSLLAEHLGIPSARVELAERDGRRGSLSQNVRPDGYELHSGHVWMSANPNIVYPGDGRVRPRPNDIVDRLTEMSDLERKFAASITITNSERVRNAIRNLAP
jgi:hypothetical protein